jgi:hypothetical protein
MSDTAASRERLDIGRVLRTTVEVTRRNLGPMLLLAALIGGLPTLVIELATAKLGASEQTANAIDRIVSAFSIPFLQGALIHLSLADLNGARSNWTKAVAVGLQTWWGLLRVGFLTGLGVLLGFVLLVVPGLMWGAMWSVAAPAYVAERHGASSAMSWSIELTNGHRWKALAILVIYWVTTLLLIAVVSALLGGVMGLFSAGDAATLPAEVIAAVIMGMLNGPIFAVLFTELRRLKEGATQIAAVFD